MDLASIKCRSGWLLSITHLGAYHTVVRQPPDRRTGVALSLRYVIKPLQRIPSRVFVENWLDGYREHKMSIRPALEHHTPRYIPHGRQEIQR